MIQSHMERNKKCIDILQVPILSSIQVPILSSIQVPILSSIQVPRICKHNGDRLALSV